ncbi:RmlC-like cupin domain-containing protein [Coniella lustricola]|uniref:RmlC-like cupin domain-containing protein n=1 Tax=Coniella lustricola TaxID=2025994 RepID=A0A2T3AM07_9PEZI|nr:RmlC-like cupin domain-containing protein [Coniella lustricola]
MPPYSQITPKLHRKEDAEVIQLGSVTCFLLEDGSTTANRIAAVILLLPPRAEGPPMHWSRMHDECFFVTKGTVRFTVADGTVDAPQGSMMVVPPRAAHMLSNPSETEYAELYMTANPGYYVEYFRMLGQEMEGGKELSPEDSEYLMVLFGTFPPDAEI